MVLTPDTDANLDDFQLWHADRTAESGTRKGGGLAVFVNDRWCNSGHITVKEQVCSMDIEFLLVSIRPYYLPREFAHVIVLAVYVPPLLTLMQLVTFSTRSQAHFLTSGDFNHGCLSSTLPTFTQYVTRDNKTLDLLYAKSKEAYNWSPLPPLWRSDHNLVHLQPVYKHLVNRQPVETRTIKTWTEESEEALKGCFDSTVCEVKSATTVENLLRGTRTKDPLTKRLGAQNSTKLQQQYK